MAPKPTKSSVPPIDKSAELAEVVEKTPETGTDVPEGDVEVAMPTTENSLPYRFKPGNGITTTDVIEIALMQLMGIVNGPQVEPGALRLLAMSADRVAQLSPEAQRWMKSMAPEAEPS